MIDTDNIYFFAYLPADVSLVSHQKVMDIVEELYKAGYKLTDGYAHPFKKPENLVEGDDIENLLRRTLPEASGDNEPLNFWCYPFEFEISFQFEEDYGMEIQMNVSLDTFTGREDELEYKNSQSFLNVIKVLAGKFNLFYGCGFSAEDPPMPEDVLALEVNAIYPINYFGSEYVSRIGKQRLLSLSNCNVEEVGEGVLVTVSSDDIFDTEYEKIADLARCIGFEVAQEAF